MKGDDAENKKIGCTVNLLVSNCISLCLNGFPFSLNIQSENLSPISLLSVNNKHFLV